MGAQSAPPDPLAGFDLFQREGGQGGKGKGKGTRGEGHWVGREEERGRGREGKTGENKRREMGGLPRLEWRSGYAPARHTTIFQSRRAA